MTNDLYGVSICRSTAVALICIIWSLNSAYAGSNAALLIGIAQYEDPDISDLKFSDSDASELASTLINYGGYDRECVFTLTNREATKKNISDAMLSLVSSCSPENDLNHVFIYFSGHAILASSFSGNAQLSKRPSQEREFLAPYDTDISKTVTHADGSQENHTFISKEWFARRLLGLRAHDIAITIDACHSAIPDFDSLITTHMGFIRRAQGNHVQYVHPDGGVVRNEYVLLSASNEFARFAEFDELQHGALTLSILREIREFRENIEERESAPLFVGDMFDSITRFFRNTPVTYQDGRGRTRRQQIYELHRPQLFRFPPGRDQMVFANIIVDRNTKTGFVKIESDYEDYELMIEGDTIPAYRDRIFRIPTGSHSLVLRIRETNYRHVLPVTVTEGAPTVLSVSLRGDLAVELMRRGSSGVSSVEDASIYLNGRRIGATGHRIRGIPAGTYDMAVHYQGRRKTKQISIRPDSPLTVVYNLKTKTHRDSDLNRLPF